MAKTFEPKPKHRTFSSRAKVTFGSWSRDHQDHNNNSQCQ